MRINIFGGPGVGKTTMASYIYWKLKALGCNVEHVPDYVKMWAYEGKSITKYDQLYFLTKQMRNEMDLLDNGVEIVICDCPLLLTVCYAEKYGYADLDSLIGICNEFECDYPSINIFLTRGSAEYKQMGRYENEMEAIVMDGAIRNMLEHYAPDFVWFEYNDIDGIIDYIKTQLGM